VDPVVVGLCEAVFEEVGFLVEELPAGALVCASANGDKQDAVSSTETALSIPVIFFAPAFCSKRMPSTLRRNVQPHHRKRQLALTSSSIG
jgi:hypothetical protein